MSKGIVYKESIPLHLEAVIDEIFTDHESKSLAKSIAQRLQVLHNMHTATRSIEETVQTLIQRLERLTSESSVNTLVLRLHEEINNT